MVECARKHGVKPAARAFNTSPYIVRKWKKRFEQQGYSGLENKSKRPHYMPNATPVHEKQKIVKLRKKYKRMGAEQVKILEELTVSAKTIRKIWREAGVRRKRRRKKYKTKQNLREIKKQYSLFEQTCEDTKDLKDIPEYWLNMKRQRLPQCQYTIREVSCGIQFLGFADELSLTHSTLFAKYINNHLMRYNLLPSECIRQTDNGSEYCGAWNAKNASAYTIEIERLDGQKHRTIYPGAYTCQSDVETVHNLIEQEFYEIEHFNNREDFMNKAYTYQLFFNLKRPNTYKENKSPWQLVHEKKTLLQQEALMLPPIDLDLAVNNITPGGNDVLTNPSQFQNPTCKFGSIYDIILENILL